MNPIRVRALEIVDREESELTDAEVLSQDATDDYWFVSLAIESLHRLPSEVEPILTCAEYTTLQAHSIIRKAMGELTKRFV